MLTQKMYERLEKEHHILMAILIIITSPLLFIYLFIQSIRAISDIVGAFKLMFRKEK